MKIFISWSGTRSKEVADALKLWLPDVLQSVTAFVSSEIHTGVNWLNAIRTALSECNFGILCLTKDNCTKPWILFEAGALAKVLDHSLVCPYLIDMDPQDLPMPLLSFQAAVANEQGTRDLVRSLNRASDLVKLSESQALRMFEKCWPELRPKLESKAKPLGPLVETGLFTFMNVKSATVLRAAGVPHKNGEPLEVVSYSGGDQEAWRLHQVEKKYHAIVSMYTDQCIDVEGTSSLEGAKIHQWEYQNGDNQKWSLILQRDGSYLVRSKHSGRHLAVTDQGIKQMADTGSRGQRWWIVPVFGS
jgi:Ricin-type beta-trefoil lectin domain-like/TIR domain